MIHALEENLSLVENLAVKEIHFHFSKILHHFSLCPSEEGLVPSKENPYLEMDAFYDMSTITKWSPCKPWYSTFLEVSHV